MSKEAVRTQAAPAAIGPYSQAIRANGVLYVSGQIPLDPATGAIVDGGIEQQTRRVLDNLKAVITAAGSSLDDVLKVTIFTTDLSQFGVINEIYGTYFAEPFPARACVQAAALPKGVSVEMDAMVLCR